MSGSSLLRFGSDFNGQLYGFLERISGSLIYRLHRLNINVGNNQVVGGEDELVLNRFGTILSKDGLSDNFGRVSVEYIKGNSCYGSSYSGGDGLARISNKIGNYRKESSTKEKM